MKRLIATIYRRLARRADEEAQVSHEHLRASCQAQLISENSDHDARTAAIPTNPSQGPANGRPRAPRTQAVGLVAPLDTGTRLINAGCPSEPGGTLSGEMTNRPRADRAEARSLQEGAEEALSSVRVEPETSFYTAVPGEENGDGCSVASTALARMTLVDFVNASEVSVRLVNALNRAHHQRILPFATIGAYVAAGDSAKGAMLSMRGIGRKVADELDTLISTALVVSGKSGDDVGVGIQHALAMENSVPTANLCAERLAELLDDVPFPDILFRACPRSP